MSVPRHPGFPAMLRAGARQPVRLSDVVRLPAFWETEVFARMHGHMPGTRYPMSALLSLSRTEMIFIGLHRASRDFSDEDVSDLAAVQKVVAAAWRYRNVRSVALAHVTAPAVDGADPAPDEVTSLSRVTDREAQVLDLLVRGWGNAQIGASLGITERTVRKHLSSVFRKGHVSTLVPVPAHGGRRSGAAEGSCPHSCAHDRSPFVLGVNTVVAGAQAKVKRARAVELAAGGMSYDEVARAVGTATVDPRTVRSSSPGRARSGSGRGPACP